MEYNYSKELEELLRNLGYYQNIYTGSSKDNWKCKVDLSGGASTNCCKNLNLDVPGGFQDLNPIIFITLAEVIGDLLSGNLPFNVANSISNILNLVGQVIETYSAQQTYFQSGPGRDYNEAYKNISNPYCSSVNEEDEQNSEKSKKMIEDIHILSEKVSFLEKELSYIRSRIQ